MINRVAIVVTAVAALTAGIALAAGTAGPTNPGTARAMAQRMLSALQLPAGATQSQTDPSGATLAKPGTYPATPDLVDVHEFWRVPGDQFAVFDWIREHAPAGSKLTMSGGGSINGTFVSQWAGFAFLTPHLYGAPSEILLITVASARGGGAAVRVDAQVVWLLERPASERIPAGARSVTVSERGLNGHRSGHWTVMNSGSVRRAASIIDALPAGQPGTVACPADFGPYVTLAFASASGGRLATAVVDGSGCGGVNLWINGRSEPWLQGNSNLLAQLSSALGIRL